MTLYMFQLSCQNKTCRSLQPVCVLFHSTPCIYSRSSPSGKAEGEDVPMDDNPGNGKVSIYDGRTFLSCAKQNNSISSVQVCFAQLRKALLESIRLVNLEQCTTSLCAQEFAPLPYQMWY